MTTLRAWFADFTRRTGETPTHIVFPDRPTQHGGWDVPVGVIPFNDVPDDVLDRSFDDGFGVAESPDLRAWSDTWVIFREEYDGSEQLCWVPRHPTDYRPRR